MPPTAASSTVTATMSSGSRRINSSSSGLAKRRSATVVDARCSAAFSASSRRVPSDRMATLLPCLTIRPLPISSRSGVAGSRPRLAARIANRDRSAVVQRHGVDHVDELDLVGRRHHHEVRQSTEIGEVEAARVRCSVHHAGPVHAEAHRQILDRNVVDDLIVRTLQEGRIDGAERPVALSRETGGECHRMLLGDPDVEHRSGNFSANLSRPVPDGIAAVMATTFSSRSASAVSALAKTDV